MGGFTRIVLILPRELHSFPGLLAPCPNKPLCEKHLLTNHGIAINQCSTLCWEHVLNRVSAICRVRERSQRFGPIAQHYNLSWGEVRLICRVRERPQPRRKLRSVTSAFIRPTYHFRVSLISFLCFVFPVHFSQPRPSPKRSSTLGLSSRLRYLPNQLKRFVQEDLIESQDLYVKLYLLNAY